MSQPKGYVDSDYLRIAAESVRSSKQRTYDLMQITPGQKVLDVGCGPASDTIALAALVGPSGQVIGVDHDPAMLEEADQLAHQAGVAAWVGHARAESASLPFESDTFDACRSERLFQHLPDPASTLAEMVRVTRPGGRVVVLDTDWGSASFDTHEVDVERRLARVHADLAAHNGYAGRQLYRLFKQQGLVDVHVEVIPNWSTDYAFVRRVTLLGEIEQIALAAHLVTEEEVQRLRHDMEQAGARGEFFACNNQMLLVGVKTSERRNVRTS